MMAGQDETQAPKTLGFLFADWIAWHCVVPNGFDLGKPFELVGWQLTNAIEFYRISPNAVYDPSRPRQAAAGSNGAAARSSAARSSANRLSARPWPRSKPSDPAYSADGPKAARRSAALTGDAPADSHTSTRPANRWECHDAPH